MSIPCISHDLLFHTKEKVMWIVFSIVVVGLLLLFTLRACKVAAQADRQVEEEFEKRRKEGS